MTAALEASGTEIVTVALRRVNLDELGKGSLIDQIDPKRYLLLPNTAGCYTADEAIRTARLARELGGWEWVKLEVIGDKQTLFPDTAETLRAAAGPAQGGLHRPAVHQRRSDRLPQARRSRLPGGDAARGADRLRNGDSQPRQPGDHPRAGDGADHRRRRGRHGLGRRARDGVGRRRGAHEHRGRRGEGPGGAWPGRCGWESRPATSPATPAGFRAASTPTPRRRSRG